MEVFGALSMYLMNGSILIMILALVAVFTYRSALAKGEKEKAKKWAWVSFSRVGSDWDRPVSGGVEVSQVLPTDSFLPSGSGEASGKSKRSSPKRDYD